MLNVAITPLFAFEASPSSLHVRTTRLSLWLYRDPSGPRIWSSKREPGRIEVWAGKLHAVVERRAAAAVMLTVA